MQKPRGLLLALVLFAPACMKSLPDQDLRILTAAPAAKLSTDDLWRDFQRDPSAARRQYFGTAVDISGQVVTIEPDATKVPVVVFSEAGQHGVRARLLDERAAETVKGAIVGARITLRCFCEGLTPQQDVILKSCIRP